MQVIKDDKSWIQLQQLSSSEAGDHTMTTYRVGASWENAGYLKIKIGKCYAQKLAHKVSPKCLKTFAPWWIISY